MILGAGQDGYLNSDSHIKRHPYHSASISKGKDEQYNQNTHVCGCVSLTSALGCRDQEDSGGYWPATVAGTVSPRMRERACLKENQGKEATVEDSLVLTSIHHLHPHKQVSKPIPTHEHTYTHTHTHTHTHKADEKIR